MHSLDPIQVTLGTTLADIPGAFVPANQEWEVESILISVIDVPPSDTHAYEVDLVLIDTLTGISTYLARNYSESAEPSGFTRDLLQGGILYLGPGHKFQGRASRSPGIDITLSIASRSF